jgi:hypothetical protein
MTNGIKNSGPAPSYEDVKDEIKPIERGYQLPDAVRKALIKEIKDNLFAYGFDWNKSELARKYKTSNTTINAIIQEICSQAKHINYEAMQILRLEKNRQLSLEELNELRSKNKPRSHVLRELRETEKEIREMRIKYGFSDNQEQINIKGESKVEYVVKVLEAKNESNK